MTHNTRRLSASETRLTPARVAILTTLIIAARASAGDGSLAARLDETFARAERNNFSVGAVVIDPETGSVLYEHDAHLTMVPASNQKLFIMSAGLELLGEDFQFRTVVGRWREHLAIIGDGDPGFGDPRLSAAAGRSVTQAFDDWAVRLGRTGDTIEGDLVIDTSIFGGPATHPSWESGDLQKWYAAPIGALNLNDNCVDLTVRPGAGPGRPATWSVVPKLSIIEVVNRCTTGRAKVPVIARPSESFTFVLSGRCSKATTLQPVPVPDPDAFFADACRLALRDAGITIRGGVRRARLRRADGSLPADFVPVAEHRTAVADVLKRIGKNSQNLFADCLFKRIGYEHARMHGNGSPSGTWENGEAALRAYLRDRNIDVRGFRAADASGLSRDDRATAAQLAAVLVLMHHHRNRDLFMESLAVAGEDGSLRKRFRRADFRFVGKTGTMNGVKSLSGYLHRPANRPLVASSIFNGPKGSNGRLNRLQEQFLTIVAESAGDDRHASP